MWTKVAYRCNIQEASLKLGSTTVIGTTFLTMTCNFQIHMLHFTLQLSHHWCYASHMDDGKHMRVKRSFWVVNLEALKMNGAEWLWTSWNLSLSCWRTPVNRVTEIKMWGPQGSDKVWIASTLTIYLTQVTELILCCSKQADQYTVHTALYTALFVFKP